MISFKGRHHQQEIILQCVRWYVAYSLSAAIRQYNHDENRQVKIRQCKYLNNIVEQDHRFIKRIIRPMLGFKSFWSARATLAEIELWRMLKKGQNKSSLPAWAQFYELAATG
jgi:transposase-like protein